ncbi:hypothetical protein Plhal710r2_c007g0031661 [Plasmopara halstedii]
MVLKCLALEFPTRSSASQADYSRQSRVWMEGNRDAINISCRYFVGVLWSLEEVNASCDGRILMTYCAVVVQEPLMVLFHLWIRRSKRNSSLRSMEQFWKVHQENRTEKLKGSESWGRDSGAC